MASLFAAFEDVERLVAKTVTEAASAVVESTSEFKPSNDSSTRHPKHGVPVSATQAAHQAKKAKSSWEEFDWQVKMRPLASAMLLLLNKHTQHNTGDVAEHPPRWCTAAAAAAAGPTSAVAGRTAAAAAAQQHQHRAAQPAAAGPVRAAAVTA